MPLVITDLTKPIVLPAPTWMLVKEGDHPQLATVLETPQQFEVVQVEETPQILPAKEHWFAYELTTRDPFDNWLVYLEDPTNVLGTYYSYSRVDGFWVQPDGSFIHRVAGRDVPASQRDIQVDHTLNLLPLSLGRDESITLWICISGQPITKPLPLISICNPAVNYPRYNSFQVQIGIFVSGLFFAMVLLGLGLWTATREVTYGWFVAFSLGILFPTIASFPQDYLAEWFFAEDPKAAFFLVCLFSVGANFCFIIFGNLVSSLSRHVRKGYLFLLYSYTSMTVLTFIGAYIRYIGGSQEMFSAIIISTFINLFILAIIGAAIARHPKFLIRQFGIANVLINGGYIITNLVALMGYFTNTSSINPIFLLPIAPLTFGVTALVIRYQETQAGEAEALRLQELDYVKGRLYANITHEFRTPITIIQGMAEKIRTQPEKWQKTGIGMIQRNSDQLLNLVNQLLDLSHLDSGKLTLHPKPIDAVEYLFYLVESFESYAETRKVCLKVHTEVSELLIQLDPERFRDIISNLASNAIKFTPAGGEVWVNLQHNHKTLVIQVKDTGYGIPEPELSLIFDRFYQSDASDIRKAEGTGIGLALTKELVTLMGGTVTVSSEVGKGSTFEVHLPVVPAEKKEVQSYQPKGSGTEDREAPPLTVPAEDLASGPRVLIIEDNPDVARYVESCLEGQYRVSHARNGRTGIQQAVEMVPDLIISDVMMPEKDGFEVCYTLKEDIRTSHIPVVLLTAKADADSQITGLRRGADAYLTKPFKEEELLIRIENLLKTRKVLQRYFAAAQPLPEDLASKDFEREDAFVQKFRGVILDHLQDSRLNVEFLSREMGISRTPLYHKISSLTGMSVKEFVWDVRLKKSKILLEQPILNISEIAFETGFQSHTYFSRKFKEAFGISPTAYRRQLGEKIPQQF
ncbi:MAG: ATP-binding protein [Bacteroidota bacterium]